MLTLEVAKVAFTPATSAPVTSTSSTAAAAASNTAPEPTASLQVSGRVSSENKDVKKGSFHTLDLEANRDVRIIKQEWDSISLNRVEEACVEGRGAEVGAIVCGEGSIIPFQDVFGNIDVKTLHKAPQPSACFRNT